MPSGSGNGPGLKPRGSFGDYVNQQKPANTPVVRPRRDSTIGESPSLLHLIHDHGLASIDTDSLL